MKNKYNIILIWLGLTMSGCFDVVAHNHAQHAFQSQQSIIKAIYLEDSLLNHKHKNEYIALMKKAVQESKFAKRSELNGIYNNWGDMFHDYLIKGAQLTIEGDAESDPKISLQKLTQANEYINKYSQWFNENAIEMEEKIPVTKKL